MPSSDKVKLLLASSTTYEEFFFLLELHTNFLRGLNCFYRNRLANIPFCYSEIIIIQYKSCKLYLLGLEPGTTYYFKCGDSSVPALSQERTFQTMPKPGPNAYPRRIAVIGDLGLTSNSSSTIDHLINNDPSLVLMVGDLAYANQYITTGDKGASCYSCSFPNTPIRETYQPRWDGWGR